MVPLSPRCRGWEFVDFHQISAKLSVHVQKLSSNKSGVPVHQGSCYWVGVRAVDYKLLKKAFIFFFLPQNLNLQKALAIESDIDEKKTYGQTAC